MSSITCRIATGKQAGRKVATLQALPRDACPREDDPGKVGEFSLYTGVAVEANEGQKIERRCRCIVRPVISEKRQSLSPQGGVHYRLETPWRNGTTHNDHGRRCAAAPRCRDSIR